MNRKINNNNPQLNLKRIREQKKVSQKELAEKLNMSQGYISEIEKNIKSPTIRVLYEIAEALEVCPHILIPVTIYCDTNCNVGELTNENSDI